MKKFLPVLLLQCLLCGSVHAQLNSYADKVRLMDSMHVWADKTTPGIALDSFETLKQKADEVNDKELAGVLELYTCEYAYSRTGVPPDSSELRLKAVAYYAYKNDLSFLQADVLQKTGDFYIGKRHQRTASIESYITAYQAYKKFSPTDFPKKIQYILTLAGAFYDLEGYDKALQYFFEALDIMEQMDIVDISVNNTIGLCYRHMKKYDSALYYFNKTYEYAAKDGASQYPGIARGNIGITYFLQGKYDAAIPLLKEDIEASLKYTQVKNAVKSMTILATIYNQQHKFNEAEQLLTYGLSLVYNKKFWPDPFLAESAYKQLYIVYSAKKDYRKAHLYADSALKSKDSIMVLNNAKVLAIANDKLEYTQRKLESEKLQNQINLARIEIGKSRVKMITAIVVLCVLAIIVLFISRLNNKIRNQKKQLEKLNAVKDRIFSIISHDLRSPLNSLVSFTQLLEQGNVSPEKMQKYVGVLKDNLGYTASVMENLLNWARTQMQGYKPVIERFNMAETAKQSVGLLAPEAQKKGIEIINNIPAETIINADFNIVSLLIRNLLSNAIKYTPPGGTITLAATISRELVRIKVCDTGIGIAPALVAEFNKNPTESPFLSTPGTNNEKGTGLGLLLCTGFARLMQGKITVESTAGKGSCFTVELPA